MIFAYFTLFVALVISCVAEYYSIVGLTSIFSSAFWPIVIMGASLGVGKITAAVWLKINWYRAPLTYKLYLVPAVMILMFLTSIGCFGFLSKSHSDQNLVSGDVLAKIALYDEKIKISKENIEVNRKMLKQMDDAVDQIMSRSADERGADKAVTIRRTQQKERNRLLAEIEAEQKRINSLNEERAPIAAEVRKVENETGPLKYIASMVYGDNPDANMLERAVRWLIILIVAVFDPLALVLILAAQQSLKWHKEKVKTDDSYTPDPYVADVGEKPTEEELKAINKSEPAISPQYSKPMHEITPEPVPPQPAADFSQSSYTINYVMPEPQAAVESAPFVQQFIVQSEPEPQPVVEPVVEQVIEEVPPETPPEVVADQPMEPVAPIEIVTDGVTQRVIKYHPSERYVTHEGKRISIDALRTAKPELVLGVNDPMNEILFGTEFPKFARSGDIYTRIDAMPHRTFKFNGTKWMQADRDVSTVYLQNTAYVQYLIGKLSSGEYDPELLTTTEQEFIEEYLRSDK